MPWFYVGQRREAEGHVDEAADAYRLCEEMGQVPGAHTIHKWATYRLTVLRDASQVCQPARLKRVAPDCAAGALTGGCPTLLRGEGDQGGSLNKRLPVGRNTEVHRATEPVARDNSLP
jgi:hypothetical protein